MIEAAGLDVPVQEPPSPHNPLFALDKIVLASHNVVVVWECYTKMPMHAVRNLLDTIDGVIARRFTVNPEVLGRNAP